MHNVIINAKAYSLLIVILCLFISQQAHSQHGIEVDSLAIKPGSNCSQKAGNFFFLTPYAARTDLSTEGGTVAEVANDGFTALGLSYQNYENYASELNTWLMTDLCLIYRLSPTRTVEHPFDPDYVGPVGSLIQTSKPKVQSCLGGTTYICEEVGGASDQQMDIWVQQIEELILQAVNNPQLNNRIVAWYLMPEEVDLNVPREKELLQRIYQAVQIHDPLKRPAWLYNANNTRSEQLKNMSPWVDAFSMGIYPNLAGNAHQRIQVRHALTQMAAANATLKYPKKILPVMEMFESTEHPINDKDTLLIDEFVRHDAYAAFANGADGLLIFSMGFRQGFDSYATYYDAWSQVAQELTELGIQEVIQHGIVLDAASIEVTNGEANIPFVWDNFDKTYPSISIRDWQYKNKHYVLIVNSSEGNVSFNLDNIDTALYKNLFSNEIIDATDGYAALTLPARGVILLASVPSIKTPDDFSVVKPLY